MKEGNSFFQASNIHPNVFMQRNLDECCNLEDHQSHHHSPSKNTIEKNISSHHAHHPFSTSVLSICLERRTHTNRLHPEQQEMKHLHVPTPLKDLYNTKSLFKDQKPALIQTELRKNNCSTNKEYFCKINSFRKLNCSNSLEQDSHSNCKTSKKGRSLSEGSCPSPKEEFHPNPHKDHCEKKRHGGKLSSSTLSSSDVQIEITEPTFEPAILSPFSINVEEERKEKKRILRDSKKNSIYGEL